MTMPFDFRLPLRVLATHETPYYFYDMDLLSATLDEIKRCANREDFVVHYAVKACINHHVLSAIAHAGLGADTVSGGEIEVAIAAGFQPEDIVFAGVGKTDREIERSLELGIGCFNVESLEELQNINFIAERMGKTARVALRVNPDIDAHTHHYITTGLAENKFGISLQTIDSVIDYALGLENVELTGLHFHIGSQIMTMRPYELLCEAINFIVMRLERRGIILPNINVGGGLGVDYDTPEANPIPDFKAYFNVFKNGLKLPSGTRVHFELGRAIVAQCGSLISRVLYVKKGLKKNFVILDAGMTELIRPALYQAHHKIENLTASVESRPSARYDVVGPVCESSDVFGDNVSLDETRRGDIIALRTAGAYGEIMSSGYNCRKLHHAVCYKRRK